MVAPQRNTAPEAVSAVSEAVPACLEEVPTEVVAAVPEKWKVKLNTVALLEKVEEIQKRDHTEEALVQDPSSIVM